MWSKNTFGNITWLILVIQLVTAGPQRRSAEYEGAPDDDGFQTYTRRGVTLRLKPRSMTIRIGGKNVSPDQLLEQAKLAKQLELVAVRQLLSTRHPVKRTSFESGHKHTSTYTLEPDGSILYKQVDDIDKEELDRRFEEVFERERQRQANKHPDKLGDWEWAENDNSEKRPNVFEAPLQPFPAQTPYRPIPPQIVPKTPKDSPPEDGDDLFNPSKPPKDLPPTFYKPNQYQPGSRPEDGDDLVNPSKPPKDLPPTFYKPNQYQPLLPPIDDDDLFNPSKPPKDSPPTFYKPNQFQPDWTSDDYEDPFNPPELPNFKLDDGDLDPFDKSQSIPVTKTNTVANTEIDKDGNTVHTTITTGPNQWRRKTVKVSTNVQPQSAPASTTTVKPATNPSLDDFLKSQYEPKPLSGSTNPPTSSTTPKTIQTINIDDLPPLAVFNVNKPANEQFLKPLGPNSADQKPIKTFKVDNIAPSSELNPERSTQTQVRTYQSTYRGNQPPTAENLNPDMLAVLKRAGIRPEDISNGQTITKTRVEPDGRIVKTTYRIKTNYGAAEPPRYNIPNIGNVYTDDSLNWPDLYDRPSWSLPRQHQSASHSGVDFSSFGETTSSTTTTTIRPAIRDREPLGGDEDDEGGITLNPLLIHPVHAVAPNKNSNLPNVDTVKSAIAEFLAKLGLSKADLSAQNGQFTKTIVDDDGCVLTARFFLTPAIAIKHKK
ncbi:uncharacterized protein LOC101461664 [Ceratitis capitata]|uniref:uncharacterized protein LOC101461664 n=1 Tax=Ceratitis capitata TaxID=7213 RepID=UPI00032A2872|nr:uncharacterized protein LOC101461664 [Ceratitis capitata]